jgi:hypothetical protein
MRDFLTEYSVAPAKAAQSRASYNATSMGNIIVNLNTAPWGQSAPFNKLCFTSTGQQAKTGCVPTAYSILMHYHQWPNAAIEKVVQHTGTGEKITLGHEYDWAKMLHSYSGTYKEEQADAVATLMRDVGYAYGVVYGTRSTESGSGGEGAGTLIDVFKYKSETPSNTSGNHTRATVRDILGNDALWKQYIQQSLDAGLPIPYSSTGDGNLKHIFILDGYTDNGYYHFNWGWNEYGNGWFTLADMSLDDGSNYSKSHKAYFMLSPNRATYTISVTTDNSTSGTVTATCGNQTGTELTVDQDAKVILTALPSAGYVFQKWTCNDEDIDGGAILTVTATANATYKAIFVKTSSAYQISVSADATQGSASVQVDGGESSQSVYVAAGRAVTLTATPKEGYEFVNWTCNDQPVSTSATYSFTPNSTAQYVANFAIKTYTITVASSNASWGKAYIETSGNSGVGTGTGTGSYPSSITVNHGEQVTIVAMTTSSATKFINWTLNESIVGTTTSMTITATADAHYIAKFSDIAQYTISASANDDNWGIVKVSSKGTVKNPQTVDEGANVLLYAEPKDGCKFLNWTLDSKVVSRDQEYYITASKTANYVANFEQIETYTVSVSSSDNNMGTAVIDDGSATGVSSKAVTAGGTLTLKATANPGYKFVKWTCNGKDIEGGATITVTATANATYKAYFEKILVTYTINASVNSTNGTAAASSNSVTEGQSVTLTATPMNGYRFVNWTKGGEVVSTDNPYTFVPTASGDYVANFEAIPVYNISTSVNGTNGTATTSSNSVTEGQSVTLTATPNDGYRFVNWTKGTEVVSSANPYTFVPTASGEYMANFEVIPVVTPQYTISVASSDNGFGSVAVLEFGTSVSGTVVAGTTLTLVATPIETCKFVKWTCNGQDIEGGATLEVTASENADYVAVFAVKESYYVSISSNPSGAGEISISVGTNYSETGMYVLEGAIVTLQATANAGYTFKDWTRGGVEISKDESFSVPVDAAADYVANFESVSQGTGVTISAVASDGGSATVNSQTTISGVEVNTPLTLVATPNAGYYFVKWQVDEEDVSTKATFTTTAQSDREYRAVFAMGGEEVVVKSSGSLGNGWIGTIGTKQVSAVKGTSIKLLAVVVEKPFLCWTKGSSHTNGGEVLSNKMVFDVVVTERTTYIANFKDPISVSVEASVNGDGGTTEITGDKSYAGEVTFVANPQTGYKFTRWTNGGETVSTEPHYTTIVTGDLNLVANFEKMSVAPSEPETTGLDVNLTMISDDDELIYGLEGAIGTFSAPYATLIPENVDVYYALKSDLDGTNALHLIHYNTSATSTVIPANQGVILVGNFNVNTTVHMIPATDEQAGRMVNNVFSNTASGSVVMQTGDYVLARGEQGIGFYQATGTLKPNKAYLSLGNTSNVSAFRLVFGETTDLNSSVTIVNPDAPIYDLSGRRVMQTVKGGVYIQNGKKFIVK